jgi:hypothetical protein
MIGNIIAADKDNGQSVDESVKELAKTRPERLETCYSGSIPSNRIEFMKK